MERNQKRVKQATESLKEYLENIKRGIFDDEQKQKVITTLFRTYKSIERMERRIKEVEEETEE